MKIDIEQGKFSKIVSNELASELLESISYIRGNTPIGQIIPYWDFGVEGIEPNPDYWQLCDGSVISNINSPLRNPQTPDDLSGPIDESKVARTPDLTDRYIRYGIEFGHAGLIGGKNEIDLAHNHGGRTGNHHHGSGADTNDGGSPAPEAVHDHSHGITTDLSVINLEPPYIGIKFYMRIA